MAHWFKKRPAPEPTIADRLLEKLSNPDGWQSNKASQYRHAKCPFMLMKEYGWDGGWVSVWDDNSPGHRVPLSDRESQRLLRAIQKVDEFLYRQARAAALSKFDSVCV